MLSTFDECPKKALHRYILKEKEAPSAALDYGNRVHKALEQRIKQTYSLLEGLRDGKMLFGSVAANADAGTPIAKAVPLANLNWYNAVSNSGFFPARRGSTYP